MRHTAIFFLEQVTADLVEPCGEVEGVCLVQESTEPASRLSTRGLNDTERHAEHLRRFEIGCELVKNNS